MTVNQVTGGVRRHEMVTPWRQDVNQEGRTRQKTDGMGSHLTAKRPPSVTRKITPADADTSGNKTADDLPGQHRGSFSPDVCNCFCCLADAIKTGERMETEEMLPSLCSLPIQGALSGLLGQAETSPTQASWGKHFVRAPCCPPARCQGTRHQACPVA